MSMFSVYFHGTSMSCIACIHILTDSMIYLWLRTNSIQVSVYMVVVVYDYGSTILCNCLLYNDDMMMKL